MKCPSCGGQNAQNASYCNDCGGRLPIQVQVQASSQEVYPVGRRRAPTQERGHFSSLAVIGFVLSFILPPIGLLLSLVACIVIGVSKKRIRGLGMAIAGIPVALLFTGIFMAFFMPFFLTMTRDTGASGALDNDARMGACTVRSAVRLYRAEFPAKCPTLTDLVTNYYISEHNRGDPWGRDFVVQCFGDDPQVYSRGSSGFDRIFCDGPTRP